MAVKAKPEGYHAVTPYLIVDGAARLIDFLKAALMPRRRTVWPHLAAGSVTLKSGSVIRL
jgi:PhnB protein